MRKVTYEHEVDGQTCRHYEDDSFRIGNGPRMREGPSPDCAFRRSRVNRSLESIEEESS